MPYKLRPLASLTPIPDMWLRKLRPLMSVDEPEFLPLDLPDLFRVLVPSGERSDGWDEFGVYEWAAFSEVDGEENVYVNTVTGSPFYLRVLSVEGDLHVCVDGGWERFPIRIVEIA